MSARPRRRSANTETARQPDDNDDGDDKMTSTLAFQPSNPPLDTVKHSAPIRQYSTRKQSSRKTAIAITSDTDGVDATAADSLTSSSPIVCRCAWAETNIAFYEYHDNEWGAPVHDDRLLFEMINLEGAQAGLSWLTILKKRAGYRNAFHQFDAVAISKFTDAKTDELMLDSGIVRHRGKIDAVVHNAKALIELQQNSTFDRFLWSFVDHKTVIRPSKEHGVALSTAMSVALKKHGFKFVGATICYAFMQAVGMVNDHTTNCFRSAKKVER